MKKTNNILSTLIILLDIIFLVKFIGDKEPMRILIAAITPFVILLPLIIKKIFKMNEYLRFTYILLVFILLFLGCVLEFYSKITWYDSIAHFLFGIFSGVFSLIVLKLFNKYTAKNIYFNIFFIITMALGISALWEIWEFTSSKIFEEDIQHVLTTGVNDTMKDIILAFLGSVLFSLWYCYKEKTNDKIIKKILN